MCESFDDLSAIGEGGRLLIEAVRRAGVGREACRLTLQEFAATFPGDGLEVLATFRVFLQAVGYASRRKMRVGTPGTAFLLPDEKLLLALIAAAQGGDNLLLDAYVCWLTRADRRMAVVTIAARALATALGAHGQWLLLPEVPIRGSSPPPPLPDIVERFQASRAWVTQIRGNRMTATVSRRTPGQENDADAPQTELPLRTRRAKPCQGG
jgi:hypothetical protein